MTARCLALGMTFIATVVTGAKEPVSIRVSPAFSYAPANLVIQASVEPDGDNRTSRFEFRSLPPGEYEITATVIGADGRHRAIAHRQVNVLESGAAR